ncbi:hypothetical protein OIU80_17565 [Flavobacterium sp. LS1R47]|uniref:Uncharacterized protein n=1 Tax=Flavobacterium frigoritolerans TaxID=2987686 RepID=A0A9X3C9K8_9FLAO|nr:hypothetical protein [Flavobacterium frigoritolerans]MCV9934093.1 hypothetical protein [Flavobacterium frigoritolerans]
METYDLYIINAINTLDQNSLDIYEIKQEKLSNNSFLESKLDLKKAKELKNVLSKKNISSLIVPIEYKEPKIDYFEARKIAEEEYIMVKNKEIKRYGDLKDAPNNPMWYTFIADDYKLQEEGYVPGYWGCSIDKITGRIVDKKEIIYYQFL